MNPVKIQIAKHAGWNQPPKMLDWDGYPIIIPGLYLTRFNSEKQAKEFIKLLATKNFNWEVMNDNS